MIRTPALVFSPHPLLPAQGREVFSQEVFPRETLDSYLARCGVLQKLKNRRALVTINGVPVPRAMWRHVRPKPGTLVHVQAALAGGGGGGGKNPIATVLSIALLVVAPVAAGALAKAIGVVSATGLAALTAGVGLVGGLAINQLFPPPKPKFTAAAAAAVQTDSPTYSLTGGANRARPYEPMPVIMGTHRVFPDAGANTYTQFSGDDQYLYQIFDFGYNDLVLSEFKIGDNPITNYTGVTIEESGEDGKLDLFPGNVDSIAGSTLEGGEPGDWVTLTSSEGATYLAVEITGFLFGVGPSGLYEINTAIEAQYRAVGAPGWEDITFATNVTPVTGVEYGVARIPQQQIDQSPGLSVGELIIRSGSRTPLRRTYKFRVPLGQYEVRLRQTTAENPDPAITKDIVFSQLRTYQRDGADYTGRKRLALRIQASGQLNGAVQQFSCLASARTTVWDGSYWVDAQETSNPAWWVLAAARGNTIGDRRRWGAGMADTRINLDNIIEFAEWCEDNGFTFNGVFDSQLSVQDMLDAIALRGRGSISKGSGKLEVVWDAPDMPEVAVFSMSNILRDSFEIDYTSEALADEIVASFANAERNYDRDVVRVLAPGTTTPLRSRNIELFGCTNEEEAAQDANLYAAANLFRTRRFRWRMDWEAMPLSRGEVGRLSHDLASYDYSGRLIEGSTDTVLKLDRAVPLASGSYVTIVKPDQTFATYAVNSGVGNSSTLTPTSTLPFDPSADPDHNVYDYRWLYGATETPGRRVKVDSIRPVSESVVEITAVDDEPEYYSAADGSYDYVAPVTYPFTSPVISNVSVVEELVKNGGDYAVRFILTWEITGSSSHTNIRYSINGVPFITAGSPTGRRFEVVGPDTGTIAFELAAVHPLFGVGAQSTASLVHTIAGKTTPPADVENLDVLFTPLETVLFWDNVPDVDLEGYEVRSGADWDAGATLLIARTSQARLAPLAAATLFHVRARDTSGNLSDGTATLEVTPTAPAAVTPLASFDRSDMRLDWSPSAGGSYQVRNYEVRYGATWAGATHAGYIDVTTFRTLANWSGARTWWVAPIDVAGAYGTPAQVEVVVTVPSEPTILTEVIDNNVLLRWTDEKQTLPIERYEIRRGEVFASAEVVGTVSSEFSVVFESVAGSYKYWVVGVDTAGNYGTPGSVVANVNQPPDYVLFDEIASTFSGTKTNCAVTPEGVLLAMFDPTVTYEDHFINEVWATPQDQIDAGFPIYIQPGTTTGSYEEEVDYGAILPGTKITVDMTSLAVAGSVTVTPTISVKEDATDVWIDYPGVWSVYATNFRYFKVLLEFSGAGREDLLAISALHFRLDVKQKGDSGNGTCAAADGTGTLFTFNVSFVDIEAITVTPQGTDPRVAVVNFVDAPFPTEFRILLFDMAGVRVDGDIYWNARGV